jgi:F-type H+-transporting ATPase subunit gamma
MANLKSIKSKILSSKKMGTVTRAMEAVSAVKMRKSQERALTGRAYAAAALTVLERVSGTADMSRHPLMQERTGKHAVIVITSDKGLAGSLNSGVIKKADALARELGKSGVVIYAFGRKGGDYFASRGFEMGLNKTNVSDDITENELSGITSSLIVRSDITKVSVVYQNFVSSFEQLPTVHEIVPVRAEAMKKIVEGIRPARGKYAPQPTAEKLPAPAAYTIEPDADEVLSVLLPKLINVAVFHALLENKASEHSARMVAMKSATDKAKEMAQAFTRKFNKVRQAVITREVSEITSGIEAMK